MQENRLFKVNPTNEIHDYISPTFKHSQNSTNFFEKISRISSKNLEHSPQSSPKHKKAESPHGKIITPSLPFKKLKKNPNIAIIKQRRATENVHEVKSKLNNTQQRNQKDLNRFKELFEIKEIWIKSESFYQESKRLLKSVHNTVFL